MKSDMQSGKRSIFCYILIEMAQEISEHIHVSSYDSSLTHIPGTPDKMPPL